MRGYCECGAELISIGKDSICSKLCKLDKPSQPAPEPTIDNGPQMLPNPGDS